MSIRHLRIFITVVSLQNMSAAAEQLFITQPSVSQAIKELEQYYGVRLFERLSKKLYLTQSGEALLKYATHLIQSFDEMETMMKNKSDVISLRIGASITVGGSLINRILNEFNEQHPKIKTQVMIRNTRKIERLLLSSKLDVALVEGKVSSKDLISKSVYEDQLILVVGKQHPFYGCDKLSIYDLQGQDIIAREEGSGTKIIFDNILKEYRVDVFERWSSSDTLSIKQAAIQSRGIAILSSLVVEEDLKKGTLHKIALEEVSLSREIYVVYHKNKFLSDSLKYFLDCLH